MSRNHQPTPPLDEVLKLRGNSQDQVRERLGRPNDERGSSLFYFVIDDPSYRAEPRLYEFSFQNGILQNVKRPAQGSSK